MALNWQFADKAKYAAMTKDDKALNDAFIWGCLCIDMGDITLKNAEEWQWRYAFAVKMNGAYFYVGKKEWIPTLDEVKKRIGLHTNVSTKTHKQFIDKMVRIYSDNRKKILAYQRKAGK